MDRDMLPSEFQYFNYFRFPWTSPSGCQSVGFSILEYDITFYMVMPAVHALSWFSTAHSWQLWTINMLATYRALLGASIIMVMRLLQPCCPPICVHDTSFAFALNMMCICLHVKGLVQTCHHHILSMPSAVCSIVRHVNCQECVHVVRFFCLTVTSRNLHCCLPTFVCYMMSC